MINVRRSATADAASRLGQELFRIERREDGVALVQFPHQEMARIDAPREITVADKYGNFWVAGSPPRATEDHDRSSADLVGEIAPLKGMRITATMLPDMVIQR